MGKLRSLDLSNRKSLVASELEQLPKTRQCELLGISRSSVYYKVQPLSSYNLNILNRIDEIYTDKSEFGYRYIYHQLLENGFTIGKDRVLKYMRLIVIYLINTGLNQEKLKMCMFLLLMKFGEQ